MININKAKELTKKLFNTKWVKWVHEGTKPAETSTEKSTNVIKEALSKHCAVCLNINGCCFVKDKCPKQPLHPNCHCYIVNVEHITAQVECPIEKNKRLYIFKRQ